MLFWIIVFRLVARTSNGSPFVYVIYSTTNISKHKIKLKYFNTVAVLAAINTQSETHRILIKHLNMIKNINIMKYKLLYRNKVINWTDLCITDYMEITLNKR